MEGTETGERQYSIFIIENPIPGNNLSADLMAIVFPDPSQDQTTPFSVALIESFKTENDTF